MQSKNKALCCLLPDSALPDSALSDSALPDSALPDPPSVGCRFKPPPNELLTESGLTVMKIQLPTGVEPYLEDLRQVKLFIIM